MSFFFFSSFSFSTLNMLFFCLWICSDENMIVNHSVIPCIEWRFLSPAASKHFSFSLAFKVWQYMSMYGTFCVYHNRNLLSFSMCKLMLFITFGKFWTLFTLNIFFCVCTLSFSSTLLLSCYTLACLMVSHRSLKVCSFSSFFIFLLLFLRLGNFYWFIFRFTDSFFHHLKSTIDSL